MRRKTRPRQTPNTKPKRREASTGNDRPVLMRQVKKEASPSTHTRPHTPTRYKRTAGKDRRMVDGTRKVFKKALMLNRVKDAGMLAFVGDKEIALMDNLDGQEVSSANWNRTVHGAPVYSCTGKDGKTYDVNEADCM